MQPRGKQVTDPKLQAMRDHPGPAVGASTRPHVIAPKTCQGSPEATGCASKRRCAPTLNKIMNSPKKAWWRPEPFLDRLSFTCWPYKPRLPLLVKTPFRGSAQKDPDAIVPGRSLKDQQRGADDAPSKSVEAAANWAFCGLGTPLLCAFQFFFCATVSPWGWQRGDAIEPHLRGICLMRLND